MKFLPILLNSYFNFANLLRIWENQEVLQFVDKNNPPGDPTGDFFL